MSEDTPNEQSGQHEHSPNSEAMEELRSRVRLLCEEWDFVCCFAAQALCGCAVGWDNMSLDQLRHHFHLLARVIIDKEEAGDE